MDFPMGFHCMDSVPSRWRTVPNTLNSCGLLMVVSIRSTLHLSYIIFTVITTEGSHTSMTALHSKHSSFFFCAELPIFSIALLFILAYLPMSLRLDYNKSLWILRHLQYHLNYIVQMLHTRKPVLLLNYFLLYFPQPPLAYIYHPAF